MNCQPKLGLWNPWIEVWSSADPCMMWAVRSVNDRLNLAVIASASFLGLFQMYFQIVKFSNCPINIRTLELMHDNNMFLIQQEVIIYVQHMVQWKWRVTLDPEYPMWCDKCSRSLQYVRPVNLDLASGMSSVNHLQHALQSYNFD